jgi:methyltransferase
MVDTRWIYCGLVALVGMERILELGVSKRNQRWLEARGAIEIGAQHYPRMVMMHLLFLCACVAEVWILQRPLHAGLAISMLGLLIGAMVVRYWVIATLGHRWTTRIFCLPGEPLIDSGPFRFLRHPNYAAVIVEIFALPLVHSAWLTAVVFSLANGLLLETRIRHEEAGLRRYSQEGRE